MGDLTPLVQLLKILAVAVIFFAAYSVYAFFFKNNKIVKTAEKPSITWELKARKQKVDTIFIYTFK